MRALTTTSYAILGLLAVRPWSAYELTQHMHRSSLRLIWPRAESQLYAEPRNLVTHRFATASSIFRGTRPPTIYTITRKGRSALRAWLAEPGSGLMTECESLLKVAYADYGTKEQLLQNLRGLRAQLIALADLMASAYEGFLDHGPAMPERLHITVLTGRFHVGILLAQADWLDWATGVVEKWPDTGWRDAMKKPTQKVLQELVDDLRRVGRRRG